MSWLLNFLYLALAVLLTPWILYRRLVLGKGRDGWAEKLWGALPRREGTRPCVWLHAVSVGEVVQLQSVLAELSQQLPEHDFVITTTTGTGYDVARRKFPQHQVCYFPLDFSWAVHRALDRIRPAAIVLVELEIWPNLVLAASRRGIPLVLINGRLSERSHRGYRRIRPLMHALLRRFECIAVQDATYAERFRDLGAPPERMRVTGSIKFDGIETSRERPAVEELRRCFGIAANERVFIAGSTQSPEEELALETWRTLREKHPELRLVLVPRHQERFEEVARLVETSGLPLLRRTWLRDAVLASPALPAAATQTDGSHESPPVLLLDTLGELSACWGLADIAFVGGSLGRRGGQNMIEPAGYGAAVLFGPNTWNFRDIVAALLAADAARVVRNQAELTAQVERLLNTPQERLELGQRAQRLVLSQQGATKRTVALILESLGQGGASVVTDHRKAA